ncbi:MAG TPA: hypothetical protein VFQ00_12915 [Terriglobales bacterium]|nr:hypothetical protein [Terriglobales bacterium]
MKKIALLLTFASLLGVALAQSTQKPRVFIAGKGSTDVNSDGSSGGNRWFRTGSSRSTIDSHNESIEMAKDFSKECTGVTVTVNQAYADYTVDLNRESKKNRGLFRSNNQIMITNRAGDMLSAGATHAVSSATKDACNAIMADWQAHGPIAPPSAAPAAAQVPAAAAPVATPTTPAAPAALVQPQSNPQ